MSTSKSAILRWSTLSVVLLNVIFNYTYIALSGHPSMGEVSHRYPSLFTPPGYTFSIWGLIYLSFLFFCIIQLQQSRSNKKIYDQLSLPLLLSNILTGVWIWVYTSQMLVASVVIITALLILSIDMFNTSARAALAGKNSWWLQFPFSLFCGWLSLAFLANLSVLIAAEQQTENRALTTGFIALAGLAGIVISLRFRNALYPAVVAWASVAIWTVRRNDHPQIALVCLIVAALSVIMVVAAFYRWKRDE